MDENDVSVSAAKVVQDWITENRIVLDTEEGHMITFIPSFHLHPLHFFLAVIRGKYTYEPRHYVHLLLGIQEEEKPWQVGRVPDAFVNAISNELRTLATQAGES